MKLYKVWQKVNNTWDTYDSMVICADSPDEAKALSCTYAERGTWAPTESLQVAEIGEATADLPKGIVVASFHAG